MFDCIFRSHTDGGTEISVRPKSFLLFPVELSQIRFTSFIYIECADLLHSSHSLFKGISRRERNQEMYVIGVEFHIMYSEVGFRFRFTE